MQTAPTIAYRNLDPSPSAEAHVARRLAVLERLSDRLTGCEVVIDAPQKRKRHGRVFRVRLTLHLPGPDIAVAREVAQGSARQDLTLAIDRAFSAAERQIKRQKKKRQGVEVKHHPPVLHGEVTRIEPALGYGYLRADDGREVYFQREALVGNSWAHLAPGTRLRFREMEGDKGAFAASVKVLD